MAGSIAFKLTKRLGIVEQDQLATTVRKAVKALAQERNIKVPKHISVGGMYGIYFFISYNTNAVRDLIIEVGKKLKLEVEWTH